MALTRDDDHKARDKAIIDAMSGVLANCLTVWAFYPIDLYKTRLQANTPCNTQNREYIDTEGAQKNQLSSLGIIYKQYEGIGWKTIHSATSSFSYFYLYSWITSRYLQQRKRRSLSTSISPQARLLLTAIAAIGNTLVTLPLDVISTRRQTQTEMTDDTVATKENSDFVDTSGASLDNTVSQSICEWESVTRCLVLIQKILSHLRNRWNIVFKFWRGLWPALLLCSNPAINYTIFDAVKVRYIAKHGRTQLGMMEAFVLGLIAKSLSTIATYPLIAAKSKLMANNGSASLLRCLRRDYEIGGITNLYRGCNVQLFHTVLKSALMMMMKEKITALAYKTVTYRC